MAPPLTIHSFNFFWITYGFASAGFFCAWFIRNVILPWELQREPQAYRRQPGFWAIKRSQLVGVHVRLWTLSRVLLIFSILVFGLSCVNAGYMAYLHQQGRSVEWWVEK